MIRLVRKSTLDALKRENWALRETNKALDRCLTALRTRFAAQILYGDTAPKNPVEAANQARENVEACK